MSPYFGTFAASEVRVSNHIIASSEIALPRPPEAIPDVCVSMSCTVISRSAGTKRCSGTLVELTKRGLIFSSAGSRSTATCISANSGIHLLTGSLGLIDPSSISIIAATPSIGLVELIMMNSASSCMSLPSATFMSPWVSRCTILPRRATPVTAPCIVPASICPCMISLMRLSCSADMPTSSALLAQGKSCAKLNPLNKQKTKFSKERNRLLVKLFFKQSVVLKKKIVPQH